MKIGIITFHWATNYGAMLQAFALQTYLESKGNEVYIINYKPKKYDFNLRNLLFSPSKLKNLLGTIVEYKKEKKLNQFRLQNMNLTRRYLTIDDLKQNPPDFDVYISGSDQVLNPFFLQFGENKGSTAYLLDFGNSTVKKIGYAVSFGCTKYPEDAGRLMQPLLENFDYISVRENSGIHILNGMSYDKTEVVPDPTILLAPLTYNLLIEKSDHFGSVYTFVYILRKSSIKMKLNRFFKNLHFSDEGEYTISSWLGRIKYSEFMITNSYHGVIFCLKFHVPFVVILNEKENVGMNDRFFTLLNSINLVDRIITEEEIAEISDIKNRAIDWSNVDLYFENARKKTDQFIDALLN